VPQRDPSDVTIERFSENLMPVLTSLALARSR
jgi:hypothetical protein